MIDILWHGRGGQGAFTAAKLLGAAYIEQGAGYYSLAFPSFGPERRGAPVRAFTKLDTGRVQDRSEIRKADYVVILDDTLFSPQNYEELKKGGRILLNTTRTVADERILTVPAVQVASEILGIPVVNTIMLGALSGICEAVSVQHIEAAVRQYMPERLQEKNVKAVAYAADEIQKRKEVRGV